VGAEENGKYLDRWSTPWTAIQGARDYFNKITEELIDPNVLTKEKKGVRRLFLIRKGVIGELCIFTDEEASGHTEATRAEGSQD
jgi:hypothetical protein